MGARIWAWWAVMACGALGACWGHGRLVEPPSRASAWRFGFDTPADYDDNEGFCGGFTHQHQKQGGRCGICGDGWDEDPRPHEAGGKYATGAIVRRYAEGQVIPVRVDVTANHGGHFEFRICPNNNPDVEASQACLNEHPLFLADGSGFQYQVPNHTGDHLLRLKLPTGVTCTQCVLQWRYVSGNNWGICEDGSGRLGCGPQEEFRACADVQISSSTTGTNVEVTGGGRTEMPPSTTTLSATPSATSPTSLPSTPPTADTGPSSSSSLSSGTCRAVGMWQHIPNMSHWCLMNCLHVPPNCPSTHCTCD